MLRKIIEREPTNWNLTSFWDKVEAAFIAVGWTVERLTNTSWTQELRFTSPLTIDWDPIVLWLQEINSTTSYAKTYDTDWLTVKQSVQISVHNNSRYSYMVINKDSFVLYQDSTSSNITNVSVTAVWNIVTWEEKLWLTWVDNLWILNHYHDWNTRNALTFYKQATYDTSWTKVYNANCDVVTNYAYSYASQTWDKNLFSCDIQVRFSDWSVWIWGIIKNSIIQKLTQMNYQNKREINTWLHWTERMIIMNEANYSLWSEFSDLT